MGQKINAFRILVGKQAHGGQEDETNVGLREENCEDEGWVVSNKEF